MSKDGEKTKKNQLKNGGMYVKILFSVFNEDRETDKTEFIFSQEVETEWSIEQVETHFGLFDLFRSSIIAGKNLCFWDIYLFSDDAQHIVLKIKQIPMMTMPTRIEVIKSSFIVVEEFDPGSADSPRYPDWDSCTIYACDRFECGASSFYSFLVKIVEHPLTQGIITNFIYDVLKKIFVSIFCRKHDTQAGKTKKIYYLSLGRFYKNFSRAINMKTSDFQMISLRRLKLGNFRICVRTITNEYYEVRCAFTGKIASFNLIEPNSIDE